MKPIDKLEEFFIEDIWYASKNEWKTEVDMIRYIKKHFEICREEMGMNKKEKRIPGGTCKGRF